LHVYPCIDTSPKLLNGFGGNSAQDQTFVLDTVSLILVIDTRVPLGQPKTPFSPVDSSSLWQALFHARRQINCINTMGEKLHQSCTDVLSKEVPKYSTHRTSRRMFTKLPMPRNENKTIQLLSALVTRTRQEHRTTKDDDECEKINQRHYHISMPHARISPTWPNATMAAQYMHSTNHCNEPRCHNTLYHSHKPTQQHTLSDITSNCLKATKKIETLSQYRADKLVIIN